MLKQGRSPEVQRIAQDGERGVQHRFERERGEWAGLPRFGFPDDMQNDILVIGVIGVAVRGPSIRAEIDFDIARLCERVAKLNDRAAKVGAGRAIPKAGMEHAHAPAIKGFESVRPKPLMAPNRLHDSLVGPGIIRAFAQRRVGMSA